VARPVSVDAAAFLFLPAATSLLGFAFVLRIASLSGWTFAANLELAVGFLASLALEAGASVVLFAALTIGVSKDKQDCAQYMLDKWCSQLHFCSLSRNTPAARLESMGRVRLQQPEQPNSR